MRTTPALIVTTLALALVLHDPSAAARDLRLRAAPIALPAKTQSKTVKTPPLKTPSLDTGSQGRGPLDGVAKGGMAGQRSRQVKQLQQLQQARQPGAALGQGPDASGKDCGIGALNPSGCVGGATRKKPEPRRQSMHDCLAGGNPRDCMAGTGKGGTPAPGTIGRGPGSPADGMKIPGRGQAQQDGSAGQGGFTIEAGDRTVRTRRGHDQNGDYTETTETGRNRRLGTTYENHATKDADGNLLDRELIVRDRNGNVVKHETWQLIDNGDGTSDMVHRDNLRHTTNVAYTRINHPNEQSAPEGSNGAPDNCDWVPGQGCKKKRADTRGMTSRPGPGEQEGVRPSGGFAGTRLGAGAVTNCGDASSEACNRGGAGPGSGGRPLDMKDPGAVPGEVPH